jgi:hypothetical protein
MKERVEARAFCPSVITSAVKEEVKPFLGKASFSTTSANNDVVACGFSAWLLD